MKVLVVLAQPPLYEGTAPGRCAVGLLQGLLHHGVDVRALAARQEFAVPGDPPPELPVEVFDVPPPSRGAAWAVQRWTRPRGELRGAFAARVAQLSHEVDVVHLEETGTVWCGEHVRTPTLVHMHYLVRRDRALGAPWRRQFRQVLEFALAEGAAIRRYRHLVASSPRVLQALRRSAPWHDLTLAPLCLDPSAYEPAPLDDAPVAGLIGTGTWPPTAAAVERLVTRVWPLVRKRVPDARLLIAGRDVSPPRAADSSIEFLGEVASSPAFLRRLSILLYPLERGSGVKVKVLEAIACGLPVVTTSVGAEGIDAGEGVILAADDDELADSAARLLTDAGECRQRGDAARHAFLARYTPPPATEPLLELYARMAG